jgi:hypothetical protein
MQVSINRRAADGLTLKGAYTWSHALMRDGQYVRSDMQDRNIIQQSFDIRQNFQMGFVYDVPFGKGKNHVNTGLGSVLLGGWQLNGVFSSVMGTPFSVTASSTALNAPGAGSQQAEQVKPTVQKIGSLDEFYDKTAFAPVNRRTGTSADWGNMRRNALRGPGFVNLDASVFRNFNLTEKFKLELRAEGFNVTNTPHFANPNGDTNSANFMRINSLLGGQFAQDGPARAFRFALRLTW